MQINGGFSLGISAVYKGTIISAGAIDLNTSTVITNLDPANPRINKIQLTCTVASGSITITAPIAVVMTYRLDGFN